MTNHCLYPLSKSINKTLILAYKESTDNLENCLKEEGLSSQVLRQIHQPAYKDYSRIYLALLNHRDAWEIAAQETSLTLILEADFVPVIHFGSLPLPFDPQTQNVGIGWIYTCASQIYHVSSAGYAVGYSTAAVGYIITPQAARYLLDWERQVTADRGPTQYYNWDSMIEEFLRARGLKCYVPFRNYGEHGGKPNPEHKKAGLGNVHQADILYDRLAFTPLYAQDNPNPEWVVFSTRLKARIKGIGRLLFNKYLRWKVLKGSSTPLKMIRFAIVRHLTLVL
jgi:hypothetical protein